MRKVTVTFAVALGVLLSVGTLSRTEATPPPNRIEKGMLSQQDQDFIKGVLPPSELDEAHRDLRQKLGQLTGSELERRYVECMVKDHEQAVALFENEIARGQDPDFKQYAQNTLPTLRQHLEDVRNLDQKLKQPQPAQRP